MDQNRPNDTEQSFSRTNLGYLLTPKCFPQNSEAIYLMPFHQACDSECKIKEQGIH